MGRNAIEIEVLREAAAKFCAECREGDEPVYDAEANYHYHCWDEGEIGCTASLLHKMIAEREPAEK